MIPSLNTLLEQMQTVSGATEIDPDTPLIELSDVDSMDLMEWLYDFQTAHPGSSIDAEIFANEDGLLTVRILHERLLEAAAETETKG